MRYKYLEKNKLNQAVILCGGLGTRLGKITKKTPKPLIKIFKTKNILDLIIYNLSRYGIKEVLLLCHYKYNLFKQKYHQKKINNCKIKCIYEKNLLGSAGSINNVRTKLDNEFLLCNGDTFFDINLLDLYTSYKKKYLGIISLAQTNKGSNRYSKIILKNEKIVSFNANNKTKLINSGICILNKKIFNYFNNSKSLEKEVFVNLCKKRKLQGKIYNKNHNLFIDIGVKKDLIRSHSFFKKVLKKKAIFLDRDGIINLDKGYTFRIKDFYWRRKIKELIKYFNDNNFFVFVVTNQSGIGRGYYSETDVDKLHDWINYKLQTYGAHIDEFQYATYFENSKIKKHLKKKLLRKPNIGMFKNLKKKWNINLKKSLVVGDKSTDIDFANNAKLNSVLINPRDDIFNKVKKQILNIK